MEDRRESCRWDGQLVDGLPGVQLAGGRLPGALLSLRCPASSPALPVGASSLCVSLTLLPCGAAAVTLHRLPAKLARVALPLPKLPCHSLAGFLPVVPRGS